MKIGANRFVFYISKEDYVIYGYPNSDVNGKSIHSYDISEEKIINDDMFQMEIEGKELYAKTIKCGKNYIVCAVPKSDIEASNKNNVAIILILFGITTICIVFYGIFSSSIIENKDSYIQFDEDGDIEIINDNSALGTIKGFIYNKKLFRRICV